jgi:hypothetical protein
MGAVNPDSVLHVALALTGAAFSGLFTAGGFYVYVRISLSHLETTARENANRLEKKIDFNHGMLKSDLAGIGSKVAKNEMAANRRYHNLSLAIMHSCPTDKENEVSHLMKEEAN